MLVCVCTCARLMDLSQDCSSITFSAGRRWGSAEAVTDLSLIKQSKATAAPPRPQHTHTQPKETHGQSCTIYLVVVTVTQARDVDSAKVGVWQGHLTVKHGQHTDSKSSAVAAL